MGRDFALERLCYIKLKITSWYKYFCCQRYVLCRLDSVKLLLSLLLLNWVLLKRYLRSKNSFFTGVPFLILGRKVFNCQHGIDRTAGEKRKRKDAEEVLYIIISFYPQPLCFCQLWLANSKGQIHEWVIWHWSQNTFMTNVITVQSWLNWRWFRS